MSDLQRDIVMIGGVAFALFLISFGPALGWYLDRRNRRIALAIPRATGDTNEFFLPKGRALYLVRKAAATPPVEPRIPDHVERPEAEPFVEQEPDPSDDNQPAEAPRVDGDGRSVRRAYPRGQLFSWSGTDTQEWSVVWDAEEITDESIDGDLAWMADPLFSLCLAPDWAKEDDVPLARVAFDKLVEESLLTGEGADLDTEWQAWNLYATKELVSA